MRLLNNFAAWRPCPGHASTAPIPRVRFQMTAPKLRVILPMPQRVGDRRHSFGLRACGLCHHFPREPVRELIPVAERWSSRDGSWHDIIVKLQIRKMHPFSLWRPQTTAGSVREITGFWTIVADFLITSVSGRDLEMSLN